MNQDHRSTALWRSARAVVPGVSLCALLGLSGCFFGHHGTTDASAVSAATPAPAPKIKPVVRPAPDFIWVGAGNKGVPLKALRGQPVVLLIAPSPDQGEFRKEVSRIDALYLDLSERKTVFLAAFTAHGGRVPSNVPYAIAANGPEVAKAYGVPPGGFAVAVISPDGNMDLISTQVEAAQRLLDMINNSYQPQAATRTGLGG
jgi:hypothetical protein